jgi:hypothetical protein
MKKIRLNIKAILRAYNIKAKNSANNERGSIKPMKIEPTHKKIISKEHTETKDMNTDLPLMLFI